MVSKICLVPRNGIQFFSMKSVKPDELAIHRAFFTEFDRYGDPIQWRNEIERLAIAKLFERKLKLLILTKAHIVVAASQLLKSPFAHDILLSHPLLLESGAIVSSMKLGHNSSAEFLEIKREEDKNKPTSPYHSTRATEVARLIDTQGTSVRWPLSSVSDWFRIRLTDDLADDHSLIRLALRREGIIPPQSLIEGIRAQEGLSRKTVDKLTAETKIPRLRDILRVYTDFIYYLSGARAIRSEGVLPQENLIDFSLSELVGRKTPLSEYEIFFKLFIDIVKAKTSTIFPVDFLDAITIEDSIELRNIAISKEFTQKYNTLQTKTKEALEISDPERLVLLLNELDAFETQLYAEFEAALDKELPTRIKEEKQRAVGKVMQAMASIFIPGYSPDSYKELMVSALRIAGWRSAAKFVEERIKQGLKACESVLESMNVIEHQILLDFVDEMKQKYYIKMFNM